MSPRTHDLPIIREAGAVRFQGNAIVRWLLHEASAHGFDLNAIARLHGISGRDRELFAQLIGYSVSGYCDLSYVSSASKRRARDRAAKVSPGWPSWKQQ